MIRRLLPPLVLLLVFGTGCGSDDAAAPDPRPPGEVGPAGGTITSSDGKAVLTIPANALTTTEILAIEPLALASLPADFDPYRVEVAYEITPADLSFALPAELSITTSQSPRQTDASVATAPQWVLTLDADDDIQKLPNTVMDADGIENTFAVSGDVGGTGPFAVVSDLQGLGKRGDELPRFRINVSFDPPKEQAPGLEEGQFSVTTRLDLDPGSFAIGAGLQYADETDASDAVVLANGTRTFTSGDFEDNTESLQTSFECRGEGVLPVRARLSFDTSFTGTDQLRIRTQAACPSNDEPELIGPPIRFASIGGVELAIGFRMEDESWDDTSGLPLAAVGGADGSAIYRLDTGGVFADIGAGDYFGMLAYASREESDEPTSGTFSYGNSGGFLKSYQPDTGFDGLGQLVDFQSRILDANNYDGEVDSGGFTYNTNATIKFIEFNPETGWNTLGIQMQWSDFGGGGSGAITGVLRTTLKFKDARVPGDVLVLTNGNLNLNPPRPGAVYLADTANPTGDGVLVGSVGIDPRRMRMRGSMVAVTNFLSDTLSVLRWSGGTAEIVENSIGIGDGPVGLDLIELPSGNLAISSAGYNDNTFHITVVDPFGNLVSTTGFPVPEGCLNPGHATWVTRGEDIFVLVSCNGSDEIFLQQVSF